MNFVIFEFKDNLVTENQLGILVISELISVDSQLISW